MRRRRFRHDELIAVDLFSGFGGLTKGIELAGFTTIMAANHNSYKVEVHEANHPHAEHWIADLINPESSDYHSARDLPPADLLVAGVSCTNHSVANTQKAYAQGLSLFDFDDPDFNERVTRSERDRATANCFPAGTVVVARRGMVPIEQVAVGDEVLTHRNRWRRVTATMSRRAPIVTVKGRGHTALHVTANHQFLTRPATLSSRGWTFGADETWTPAGDLVGHAWQSPVEFPAAAVPAPPEGWEYGDHFWWTVGRWLGDGWIRHCTPSGEMVGICCGHAERAELDGRWDARATETATTVQYELRGSGPLARWLMTHFGELAHGKTIPSWALSMDIEHRKALVEGYLSADGCSSLDGRRGSCTTVSRRLAVGMKLLLQTLGYRPTLGCRTSRPWRIEGRTGTTRPTWVVQWMAEQRRASTIATIDGRCVGAVRSVVNQGHEAEVFDIEVEEDHSFVADGVIVHNCVLHYAAQHHPRMILVECTTELTSWGPAAQGKKYGDGSTFRWWIKQFGTLGYKHRVLYLNSMFFGVPQSRDRIYIAFWDKHLPTPDLDHRPESWCSFCDTLVQAVWTWKTGIPPTGSVRYGKQYEYRCPSCRGLVVPPFAPSLHALDLSNLGIKIGDKPLREFKDKETGEIVLSPLAPATMARAERCRQRFADFPAVLMPAKAQALRTPPAAMVTKQVMVAHRHNGDGQHITRPMDKVTSTPEKAVLLAVNNFQGAPRGVNETLPTQGGSETLSLLSTGVLPFRKNTTPTSHAEAMPTVTSDQTPGVLTAAGTIKNNGSIDEAKYRAHGLDDPLGTVVGSAITQSMLFSGWHEQDGTELPHAEWREVLATLKLEDCYFRMMGPHEVGRGCGFDVDFAGRPGTFTVWGSARDQVDGFGNAVSPPVGHWIGSRLRAALHAEEARA
ncbi:DNA cytosine methyltransferase [Streptosporangium sp. NPDC051023]|uniref:DNA cytosine methyltransferase n=1 Tax=Streptosporangium sp. NPDC051023 TaxID=3155410 RepID=UPI00344E8E0E